MQQLDAAGVEHYAFHVHPQGEATMLGLVDQGFFDGIIDLTLPGDCALRELRLGEKSQRLLHASRAGIPQVCCFGGIDLIGAEQFSASELAGRPVYEHTKEIVFVRSSREENAAFGAFFARQLGEATAPVVCLFPMRGVSFASRPGGSVCAPENDRAFVAAFQKHAGEHIRVMTMECNINDAPFADRAARLMLDLLA